MAGNLDKANQLRDANRDWLRDTDHAAYHFHTGRGLAARLGYDGAVIDALPDAAVESFAGVANPFSLRPLVVGERSSMLARARALTPSLRPAR